MTHIFLLFFPTYIFQRITSTNNSIRNKGRNIGAEAANYIQKKNIITKKKKKTRNNKKAIHFFELAGTIQHDSGKIFYFFF